MLELRECWYLANECCMTEWTQRKLHGSCPQGTHSLMTKLACKPVIIWQHCEWCREGAGTGGAEAYCVLSLLTLCLFLNQGTCYSLSLWNIILSELMPCSFPSFSSLIQCWVFRQGFPWVSDTPLLRSIFYPSPYTLYLMVYYVLLFVCLLSVFHLLSQM